MRTYLSLGIIFLILSGCTCTKNPSEPVVSTAGPEEVVRHFVELSATAKDREDKRKLQELCTGAMRSAFEKMSEEVFRISYFNSNVKIKEFKIGEAVTENDAATVQYQVSIENNQGTDPTQEINQREVGLTRTATGWRIHDIRALGSDQVAFTRGMIF